jgi:hypothetical protein
MANVTLRLKLYSGANDNIQVPRDIEIEQLEDAVATQLGGPISGLSHQGRRLEKGRQLSDYLFLDFAKPFYVLPYMPSGHQPSIVHMSNANKQYRRNRLEAHLQKRLAAQQGGRRRKTRRGSKKSRKAKQTRRR